MRLASIVFRADRRSIDCCALEGDAGPPAKKYAPPLGRGGGKPDAPYCTTVKLPVVVQPGTGTTPPSEDPAPASAPPFTTRLPLGTAP
jgi:hypothetical protein